MVEIEFEFNQNRTVIQVNLNDKFEEALKKYINKTKLELNKLYFLSNGDHTNNSEISQNIMNESKKQKKRMKILVYSKDTLSMNDSKNLIKSKEVICPICNESCKYKIENYKIKLYDCKNGHTTENIRLNDYMDKQNINISKIKCDICKDKNKSETYQNLFYICNECNKNICPLCKSLHDKEHTLINYDDKNYICKKHNEKFTRYCEECKIDICVLCENEQKMHKTLSHSNILIDIKKLRNKMNDLRNTINKFNENIKEIIKKFNKTMEYMEMYYNINNKILNDYENNKNRNYNILLNLNGINDSIKNEIDNIKNKYGYGYNLNRILYIYSDMVEQNKEIEINYIPKDIKEDNEESEDNNEKKVRIFSQDFVYNNIYKCKIIYKNEEYELDEYINNIDLNYNNKDEFTLKLRGINNITDMSSMFFGCETLSSLPDISNWNTSNVTNMTFMFEGCKTTLNIPSKFKK